MIGESTVRNRFVAVVDDDEGTRSALRHCLEAAGHRVFEAQDGCQLLKIAAVESLDLVILDVLMPVMNGFEACRQLRRKKSQMALPVLFATGLAEAETVSLCAGAGGNDIVTKPFHLPHLMAKVQQLLTVKAYHELMNAVEDLSKVATRMRQHRAKQKTSAEAVGKSQPKWGRLPAAPQGLLDRLFCELDDALNDGTKVATGENLADAQSQQCVPIPVGDDPADDDR
jgi:CheY-like chemotaxis protein